MKKLTLAAVAAFSLSAGSALAVTVDFDALSTGVYAAGTDFDGVKFAHDIEIRTFAGGAGGPGMSGNIAREFESTGQFTFEAGRSVSGAFDGFTVSTLSLVAGDSGGDVDILKLIGYDINGNIVDETAFISSTDSVSLSVSGAGIASFFLDVEDRPLAFEGSSNFDNISFDVELTAVPLPATLPLIGFGLVALGAAARRRKS